MVMFTKAIGTRIKPMEKVSIFIVMELNIRATGLMINRRVKGRKFGLTVLNTKGITLRGRKRALEPSTGLMGLNMKGIFPIIIYTVMVFMFGEMEENISEAGKIIKWTERENSFGLMAGDIKENT
jgi:hypothetical protein